MVRATVSANQQQSKCNVCTTAADLYMINAMCGRYSAKSVLYWAENTVSQLHHGYNQLWI